MTNTDTTAQPRLIAAARLEKSPLNARRTVRPDGIGELTASIRAHGLMQNLVVTDAGNGTFHVIAGSRRLEAIRSLQAEGALPEDFAVPCQVVSERHALEMSLAENTVRLAMHPADQFEAFAELIEQGRTAAEVAERFGVEENLVHKRMKLARVAPSLLQEYRDGGLSLECLMAFAISDDHRRQVKLYKSLRDWQKDDPDTIRDSLTEKMVEAGSKLARFVGLEAYAAAGGASRADLFSEQIYLENPTLLNRLADKKLAGIRQELEAEGWGWIEVHPDRDYTLIHRCTRLQPIPTGAPAELLDEKSRLEAEVDAISDARLDDDTDELASQEQSLYEQLEAMEENLAAFVGFDAVQKTLAGCFVSINQDGSAAIDRGLVKPEHRKQLAKLLGTESGCAKTKPKGALSESLRRDLAASRLQIAQVELARHPSIALDLLVFQVASDAFGSPADDGADIQFRRQYPRLQAETKSPAELALAAVAKSLPRGWLKPKSEAARFATFRELPEAAKLDLLAYCIALTLKPKLAPGGDDEATVYDAALSLTQANAAGYWRPTADNFLGRVTRGELLAIGRTVLGESWSQARASDKKSSLVEQLGRAFADPDKSGRTPEQVEKLKTWLPAGMSFESEATAKPAKARRAKKAA